MPQRNSTVLLNLRVAQGVQASVRQRSAARPASDRRHCQERYESRLNRCNGTWLTISPVIAHSAMPSILWPTLSCVKVSRLHIDDGIRDHAGSTILHYSLLLSLLLFLLSTLPTLMQMLALLFATDVTLARLLDSISQSVRILTLIPERPDRLMISRASGRITHLKHLIRLSLVQFDNRRPRSLGIILDTPETVRTIRILLVLATTFRMCVLRKTIVALVLSIIEPDTFTIPLVFVTAAFIDMVCP